MMRTGGTPISGNLLGEAMIIHVQKVTKSMTDFWGGMHPGSQTPDSRQGHLG